MHAGLSHIFHASFITPKQRFWCSSVLEAGENVPPPWSVEYNNSNIEIWPGDLTSSHTSLLNNLLRSAD